MMNGLLQPYSPLQHTSTSVREVTCEKMGLSKMLVVGFAAECSGLMVSSIRTNPASRSGAMRMAEEPRVIFENDMEAWCVQEGSSTTNRNKTRLLLPWHGPSTRVCQCLRAYVWCPMSDIRRAVVEPFSADTITPGPVPRVSRQRPTEP